MPPAPKKKAPTKKTPIRRKKRRAPLPWRGILGTLLAVNVVYGIMRSPALSVRRVVIEGANPNEAEMAEKALAGLRGRPIFSTNVLSVETAALADSRFLRADFRRSIFGSARLKLTKRVPVAIVVDTPPLLLDSTGTVYDGGEIGPDSEWKGLPRLTLRKGVRKTAVALAAPVDLGRLADLAVRVRPIIGERPLMIDVLEQGVICLNMESALVRLGTGDRLEAKLSTLRRILEQKPGILREIKELNLMAPDRPKTIPRGANSSSTVSTNSPEARPSR